MNPENAIDFFNNILLTLYWLFLMAIVYTSSSVVYPNVILPSYLSTTKKIKHGLDCNDYRVKIGSYEQHYSLYSAILVLAYLHGTLPFTLDGV